MKKRGPFYNLVEFGAYDPVNGMRIEFVNLMGAIGSECQNGEKHTFYCWFFFERAFYKKKKIYTRVAKANECGFGRVVGRREIGYPTLGCINFRQIFAHVNSSRNTGKHTPTTSSASK
jgi:hypothetical protein